MQVLIPVRHQQDTEHLLQTIQIDVLERSYAVPFSEQLFESARTGQWLRIYYRSERGASQQTILPRRLYCAAGFWAFLKTFCSEFYHLISSNVEEHFYCFLLTFSQTEKQMQEGLVTKDLFYSQIFVQIS